MRLFSRRQSFQETFFLDSKPGDNEAPKIKTLRNPKTSTQNKTSKFLVLSMPETQKIIAYCLKISTD